MTIDGSSIDIRLRTVLISSCTFSLSSLGNIRRSISISHTSGIMFTALPPEIVFTEHAAIPVSGC